MKIGHELTSYIVQQNGNISVEWLVVLGPAVFAVSLFIIPGMIIAVGARQKGFDAVAIAPALSVATVAISAMIAPKLGVSWNLWVPLVFAVLLAALAFATTALAGRFGVADYPAPASIRATEPQRWFSASQGWAYLALVLAGILLARNIGNAIGDVNWISQTYDVNFHLNAIRYIADVGNASSLEVLRLTSGGADPEFYPAAWHAFGAFIVQYTGASVPITANVMNLVVGAFIWPLSVIYLMRNLRPLGALATLLTGVLSAAFIGFPLLLINFGVLYPNSLGLALIPAGLSVVAQMFRVVQVRPLETVASVYLGLFVALGIALAHPNAIMSLLVLTVPIFMSRIFLQGHKVVSGLVKPGIAVAQVAGLLLILATIYTLWGIVRPPKENGGWGPAITQNQAFGEALLNGSMGSGSLWFASLLGIVGIYALIRERSRLLWLLGAWGVAVYFYLAMRSLSFDDGRDWVTGVWYHDPFRVAALMPVVTAPLAVLGADYLIRRLATYRAERGLARPTKVVVALTGAATLLVAGYMTQNSKALKDYIDMTFWSYAPSAESPLLTEDEIDVLNHVADYVPEGDKIVVNPWTGAGLAYAYSDREVTAAHTLFSENNDTQILHQQFDEATPGSEVCQVIQRENAYYALDFGEQEIIEHIHGRHLEEFSGLQELDESAAVEEVYSSGDVALYRVTACE